MVSRNFARKTEKNEDAEQGTQKQKGLQAEQAGEGY
jgi:hypothetical protein